MTLEERSLFWGALQLAEKPEDSSLLNAAIRYPNHIYRYRSVDTKSLSALRDNRLYFSTSNYYDDPTDTYIHMKRIHDEFKDSIRGLSEGVYGQEIYEAAKLIFNAPDMNLTGVDYNLLNGFLQQYIESMRNDIRKRSWSICFSESGILPTMWIKYANQHKGFALEYDLYKPELFHGESFPALPLYPMYYAEKKYDASRYAMHLIIDDVTIKSGRQERVIEHRRKYPCMWEAERVALIKHISHQYDEEWRIIVPLAAPLPANHIVWVPSAVILGLNMPDYERCLVAETAIHAGISTVKQCFINDNCDIDAVNVTHLYSLEEN